MSPDNRRNGSRHPMSPGGTGPQQGLVPGSSRPFTHLAPGASVGKGNYAVVWNGQHCFGWVSPADELRLFLERKQAQNPSPDITIIEYHSAQPPRNANLCDELVGEIRDRLDAIDKRLDATDKRLETIDKCLQAICERVEQAIVPLAEQSRSLRNNELDMHVVRPHLELIIQTLSRMDEELRDETNSGVFGVLRVAREADREEHRQLLRQLGISTLYPKRGERFAPPVHRRVSEVATTSAAKVGRVRRVMRPAYVRERDGEVITRAWVEVYVEHKSITHLPHAESEV